MNGRTILVAAGKHRALLLHCTVRGSLRAHSRGHTAWRGSGGEATPTCQGTRHGLGPVGRWGEGTSEDLLGVGQAGGGEK